MRRSSSSAIVRSALLLGGLLCLITSASGADPADLEEAEAAFQAGAADFQNGEFQSAVDSFQRSFDLVPDSATAYFLSATYARGGAYDEAEKFARRALSLQPPLESKLQADARAIIAWAADARQAHARWEKLSPEMQATSDVAMPMPPSLDVPSRLSTPPAPEPGHGGEGHADPGPASFEIVHIEVGSGPSPKPTDTVRVHYQGTFPDGRVFDSSVRRGRPARFPLNRVIPCWTKALQQMKVGGRAKVVCPPELAYGARGAPPTIPPDATLHFEVELLGID